MENLFLLLLIKKEVFFIEVYLKVLEIVDIFSVVVWVNYGNYLYCLEKFEEVLVVFECLIIISENFYLVWYGKVNVLFVLGRYDIVIDFYIKIVKIKLDFYLGWWD